MTGQGHASGQLGSTSIEAEVRSVNNRFLKVTSRISDRLQGLDGQIEALVRDLVRRGTVQVTIRLTGEPQSDEYRLNTVAIESYARQAMKVAQRLNLSTEINIGQLLQLPGVVEERKLDVDDSELQTVAKEVLRQALLSMNRMREQEGESMGDELSKSLQDLQERTSLVSERAPLVVEDYRSKLHTRIEKALLNAGATVDSSDLIREVQIYADRSDIREEIVRLESHFKMFSKACNDRESQGRKLDFLVQELNREINTIGSKANDAAITEQVVSMKTTLEQVRELIQNIE